MSEWLRRQTRNLLGCACAGSNPAVDVSILFFLALMIRTTGRLHVPIILLLASYSKDMFLSVSLYIYSLYFLFFFGFDGKISLDISFYNKIE